MIFIEYDTVAKTITPTMITTASNSIAVAAYATQCNIPSRGASRWVVSIASIIASGSSADNHFELSPNLANFAPLREAILGFFLPPRR
jgi:hypothetical protein